MKANKEEIAVIVEALESLLAELDSLCPLLVEAHPNAYARLVSKRHTIRELLKRLT